MMRFWTISWQPKPQNRHPLRDEGAEFGRKVRTRNDGCHTRGDQVTLNWQANIFPNNRARRLQDGLSSVQGSVSHRAHRSKRENGEAGAPRKSLKCCH